MKQLSKNTPVPQPLLLASHGLAATLPLTTIDVTGFLASAEEMTEKKETLNQKIAETSGKKVEALSQQTEFIINAKLVQGKRYIVPR